MTDSAGSSKSGPRSYLSSPSSSSSSSSSGHFRSGSTGPVRLASLRTRDMTLVGPPKKPRRTFEPNVHVVRKSKEELKVEEITSSKQQRLQKEEKRKERRVVKREKPRIIQSHSIFEQGPATSTQRTGRGSTLSESNGSLCAQLKREPEESHTALSKLYRDDFIDDPTLRNSSKLKPIQLPLKHASSLSVTDQSSGVRNMEVYQEMQPSLVELLNDLHVSDKNELFFMQLPDCMPVKTVRPKPPDISSYCGPSLKPTKRDNLPQGRREQAGTDRQTQDPVLSNFSEGFLGKLQLRKSGKVVLKLGDIDMDVTEGSAFSFLQQLVSVRLSEGRTGDMTVLGNVNHKLVLSPVFQTLLDQSQTKNS